MGKIIKYDKSIVIACDVENIRKLRELIRETYDIEGIGGYKIGSVLAIYYGLKKVVNAIREFTDLPIIYDHQKAMTDIPDLGEKFVKKVKDSGCNALIGFPLAGPVTQESWIKACKELNVEPIIGGEMTHPKYRYSEGGYIVDDSLDRIYLLAAEMGVNNFVVPGNKIDRVTHYRKILELRNIDNLTFFSPGFVAQGGKITETAKVAGDSWHAIIGRPIYTAKDIRKTAKEYTKEIIEGW